jgi:hypothetical protein
LSKRPVKYWDGPLYSAVPSRSFFPRGFLWDEGFHNLLISKWSKTLSADIVAHWLDLMNVEGWIPREQILGLEARSKVPSEFLVQHNKNANPPTLLLTLSSMVQDFTLAKDIPEWFSEYLNRIWPRLVVWYNWFNDSQRGEIPGKGFFRSNCPRSHETLKILWTFCDRKITFCDRKITFCDRKITFCERKITFCERKNTFCDRKITFCVFAGRPQIRCGRKIARKIARKIRKNSWNLKKIMNFR